MFALPPAVEQAAANDEGSPRLPAGRARDRTAVAVDTDSTEPLIMSAKVSLLPLEMFLHHLSGPWGPICKIYLGTNIQNIPLYPILHIDLGVYTLFCILVHITLHIYASICKIICEIMHICPSTEWITGIFYILQYANMQNMLNNIHQWSICK